MTMSKGTDGIERLKERERHTCVNVLLEAKRGLSSRRVPMTTRESDSLFPTVRFYKRGQRKRKRDGYLGMATTSRRRST